MKITAICFYILMKIWHEKELMKVYPILKGGIKSGKNQNRKKVRF